MEPEEKVIQPESVTNAEQSVTDTPSQPQAPNLDAIKQQYEAQVAAAKKEAVEAQENLRASRVNLMKFTNKKKKSEPGT